MERISYNTKQKNLILAFLKDNTDKQLTCDEIVSLINSSGSLVGKTTVYRYLIKLAEVGELRKIIDAKDKITRFQYIDKELHCHSHMHLKCLSCGDFIHLCCDFMNGVNEHISKHHNFTVDNSKTVLYGLCEKCSAKEKG